MTDSRIIRCQCCRRGGVKMAERDERGMLRIVRRSHGVDHEVVVDPKELLKDNLSETKEISAS